MASSSLHSQRSTASPFRISTQSVACLLVFLVASTVLFNLIYLLPHLSGIPINENVFSEYGHMHVAASRRVHEFSTGTGAHNNNNINNNSTADRSQVGSKHNDDKESISDWFQKNAGIDLTPEMEAKLPTWSQVREVVGTGPVILGLESCPAFREKVPPLERMLGASGMFNTGTNLLTRLIKENCEIPERREKFGPHQSKESYGMRWQVPWGKHTPVKFRREHSTKKASDINKEYILPVVTIRHPYSWFGSMCKNCYSARWEHIPTKKNGDGKPKDCPRLRQGSSPTAPWNTVTVKYAENREDHHTSLAHLWNDWYSYYLDKKNGADFPFVVVRMEDMIFYPEETLTRVCECAGGKIRTDRKFELITDSAKGGPGHDQTTGIYEAWIKYSKPNTRERYGFSEADYNVASTALDGSLMETLGYDHPS